MFDGRFRAPIEKAVRPVGNALKRTGMSPDHLTILGVVISFGAAVLIARGQFIGGFALVIAAALPDLLDGALAKASGSSSQRGAFFDSVIDRITDAVLFGGLAWHYAAGSHPTRTVVPFAIMGTSMVISYERAKAESLGLYAKGGLMERAERIILLCIGLVFSSILWWVLCVMLVLTTVTMVQRFWKVWKQAEVAPVVAQKQAVRRDRRSSRRATRSERLAQVRVRRRPRS